MSALHAARAAPAMAGGDPGRADRLGGSIDAIASTSPAHDEASDLIALTPLQAARLFLLELLPTRESVEYLQALAVEFKAIEAEIGCYAVTRCAYRADGSFDFAWPNDRSGRLSAVIPVFDETRVRVIDLCAWPVEEPEAFATMFGVAEGLGCYRVKISATFIGGAPLPVHRTPQDWLRAACDGVVLLDALERLAAASGDLLARDVEHACSLAAWLRPLGFRHSIRAVRP